MCDFAKLGIIVDIQVVVRVGFLDSIESFPKSIRPITLIVVPKRDFRSVCRGHFGDKSCSFFVLLPTGFANGVFDGTKRALTIASLNEEATGLIHKIDGVEGDVLRAIGCLDATQAMVRVIVK